MKNEHGLTQQQEKFAQGVASGLSQADAYRAAYPRSTKWKDQAVWVQASALMANSKVSVRVKALAEKVEEEFVISTAKLLREAARIAFVDPRKLVFPDGKPKLLHELDDDIAAAVSQVEIDEYGRQKFKMHDKNNAQERLFKYKGLFLQDNKQKTDPMAELARAIQGGSIGPVKSGG